MVRPFASVPNTGSDDVLVPCFGATGVGFGWGFVLTVGAGVGAGGGVGVTVVVRAFLVLVGVVVVVVVVAGGGVVGGVTVVVVVATLAFLTLVFFTLVVSWAKDCVADDNNPTAIIRAKIFFIFICLIGYKIIEMQILRIRLINP
jgi:hypothetical protein